jgi:tetratricopeptide (TPR) repeat protein
MNLPISRSIPAILLLALSLAACVSTDTHLYRGEMELVTVSGDACPEKDKISSRIPLELVLERNSSSGSQPIAGYFNGPDMQTGHFLGNDITQLLVAYPGEADSVTQGHTLVLSPTPDGMIGELREKPQGDSGSCYFEKAAISLKRAATGSEAKAAFERQRKLFSAEEYYNRGQALLKNNNPGEALRNLNESLKLRNEVDPNDPNRVYPIFSIAIAHIMTGREGKAMAIMRDLFKEKPATGIDMLKLRVGVSGGLCAFTNETDGDALQKAAEQLMDAVAREFGGLNGVGDFLNECYRELGRERLEQGDADQSIEYFRKALTLNPEDSDSIIGVVVGFIARDAPAEGRRFLQEHAQIVMDKAGRSGYNGTLSFLYAAEARLAEKAGDYAHAEQLLREALKIVQGERTLTINLSRVLGKMAKPDEARKLLEEARNGCGDETCRLEYADELARQERIELMVKRLERER